MKEKYIKPAADVATFSAVDVITTSSLTETTTPSGGSGPIELPDIEL